MIRYSLKIGLFFSIVFITFVALELGVRTIFDKVSYDDWRRFSLRYLHHPDYHWSLKPGIYDRKGEVLTINSHGTRGPEFSVNKEKGTIRILFLGGSSTFNPSAKNGDTWPVLLGRRLEELLSTKVEVINGGTPGYSTYQSSIRLEKQFLKYEPDVIIVYHLWNGMKVFRFKDLDDMILRWEAVGRENENKSLLDPFPFLDWLSRYSQFVTHARFAYIKIVKSLRKVDTEGWISPNLDNNIEQAGIEFYRQNLKRIVRLSRNAGIPVILVKQVLLTKKREKDGEPEIKLKYVGFDHKTYLLAIDAAYRIADQLAEEEGVWSVDTSQFPANNTGYQFMQDNVHFTTRGLEKLVDVIDDKIAEILRLSTF